MDYDGVSIKATYFRLKAYSKTSSTLRKISISTVNIANNCNHNKRVIYRSSKVQEANLVGSSLRAGNVGGQIIIKG
jgi:hypothetical protein